MNDDATDTARDPKAALEAAAAHLGLTIDSVFIPWQASRRAGESRPSLNWKVTVHKNGKPILTTDYSAGCGHCPSYRQTWAHDPIAEGRVRQECHDGRSRRDGKPILPSLADVLHSLALDSEVLEYPDFETWAEAFGLDPDSRKEEESYWACLKTALALRAAIGEGGLTLLRQAGDGY